MADRSVIESLMREITTYVSKSVQGPDFAAAVDTYCRHFSSTPNAALAQAVDRWIGGINEARPPFAVPSVSTIRALLPKTRTPEETAHGYNRPAEALADSHRLFKGASARAAKRPAIRHEHAGPGERAPESCPACRAMAAGLERQAALVAELPGDPWAGSSRPCLCDGSGWIDTIKARAAILAIGWDQVDDRAVYPCRECRPDQFFDFVKGNHEKAS